MNDSQKLLERQAAWQDRRAALTWSEKIRMAEAVREWAAEMSRARRAKTGVKRGSEAGKALQQKAKHALRKL